MSEQIEGFHISAEQKHCWNTKNAEVNCVSAVIGLPINISQDDLHQAIINTIADHEILRTCFRALPGMVHPLQVVLEEPHIRFDQTHEEMASKEEEREFVIPTSTEGVAGFDLEHGPLICYRIGRSVANRMLLNVTVSTLNLDAFSFKDFVADISAHYDKKKTTRNLDEIMQFIDFSEWQREFLSSPEAKELKNQWPRYDEIAKKGIRLPYENKTAPNRRQGIHTIRGQIPDDLVGKLEYIAQQSDSNIGDLLHTAFNVLLWRLSGQDDIVVHRLLDGRTLSQLKNAIGPYCKAVPVASRIDGSEVFPEVLESLTSSLLTLGKPQLLSAYDYDESATSEKAAELVGFQFDAWSEVTEGNEGNERGFSLIDVRIADSRFKLMLTCLHLHSGLYWRFSYALDRYGGEDIERIAEYFLTLLGDIGLGQDIPVGALNYVTDCERQRRLTFTNSTIDEPEHCLHEIFSKRAAQIPTKVALIDHYGSLCFGEVEQKSNHLARHLIKLGVRAEIRVGLCIARSCQMIVSLFGILKAGGVYVPLDPDSPKDRLSALIEDAVLGYVLMEEYLAQKLAQDASKKSPLIVCVDAIDMTLSADAPIVKSYEPDSLAYVLYTSGTTGTPRGVEITHRSVINLLGRPG